MPVELAAAAFGGTYTAERDLRNLRVSRLDPWLDGADQSAALHVGTGRPGHRQLARRHVRCRRRPLAIPSAVSLQVAVRGIRRATSTRHALPAEAQGDASPDLS